MPYGPRKGVCAWRFARGQPARLGFSQDNLSLRLFAIPNIADESSPRQDSSNSLILDDTRW
jgi:hypothetical protein